MLCDASVIILTVILLFCDKFFHLRVKGFSRREILFEIVQFDCEKTDRCCTVTLDFAFCWSKVFGYEYLVFYSMILW